MNNHVNNINNINGKEIEETAENRLPEESQMHIEKVHLEVYQRGMEIWQNEVQILLCPILENGRNAIALHDEEVEFELAIYDYDDNEKKIRLHPSSMYGEGHRRGLSVIRFTPCLGKKENYWVPSRNAEYWISFKAIGTDGKLYISDEAKIMLNACPVIHGKPICNFSSPAVSSSKASPAKGSALFSGDITPEELAEQVRITFGAISNRLLNAAREELLAQLEELDDPDEITEQLKDMIADRLDEFSAEADQLKCDTLQYFEELKDSVEEFRNEINEMFEDALYADED